VTPDHDALLVDVFREKAETTDHQGIMQTQYDRYKPHFQLVEKAFTGLNIIQQASKRGLPVIGVPADTDKLSRSLPMQARYEVGAVYHRKDAPWLDDIEAELLLFPNGKHDDFVDTASMAGIRIAGRGPRLIEDELPTRPLRVPHDEPGYADDAPEECPDEYEFD
jgi:predicted phage terminase large subunit-like protein